MAVNCKTPGLRIDWSVSGSWLYATLVHEATNAPARGFTSGPIEGGKRRFAAKVDECVGHVDWTRPAADIVADAAAKNAIYSIPYDCR